MAKWPLPVDMSSIKDVGLFTNYVNKFDIEGNGMSFALSDIEVHTLKYK